jgi:hypothetical protein
MSMVGRWTRVLSVAFVGGCNAHPLVEAEPLRVSSEKTASFCRTSRAAVDVVLVIDDSPSMGEEAAVLQIHLASILSVYEREGSIIDYRMAVTTTDLGNPRCDPSTRDDGALLESSCLRRLDDFRTQATIESEALDLRAAGCSDLCDLESFGLLPTAAEYGGEARPRPWIEREAGVSNVPAHLDPAQVLQCMAPPGVAGCAFESPLEAARQAILRSFDPDDPAHGFLRPHAALFVLFITDEPDCSFRPEHADIFEPGGNRVFWSDPDADQPTSAVCFNAGMQCSGGPARYDDCWPVHRDVNGQLTDPEHAVLEPVQRYGTFFRGLQQAKYEQGNDPWLPQIWFRVLGGVGSSGDEVYQNALDPLTQDAFGIGPGCSSANGEAYPPSRLAAVAEGLTPPGVQALYSTCDRDWSRAAACVPAPFGVDWGFRPSCFEGCVADADPSTPEVLEPECTVKQIVYRPDGTTEPQTLPRCDETPQEQTCWEPLTGPDMSQVCADPGYNLEFQLHRIEPAPAQWCLEITCKTSNQPQFDCPSLP